MDPSSGFETRSAFLAWRWRARGELVVVVMVVVVAFDRTVAPRQVEVQEAKL